MEEPEDREDAARVLEQLDDLLLRLARLRTDIERAQHRELTPRLPSPERRKRERRTGGDRRRA